MKKSLFVFLYLFSLFLILNETIARTEEPSSLAAGQSTLTMPSEEKPRSDSRDFFRPSYEGFYPIWETTGFVQSHRGGYIGSNGAHFGILNVAQVGVQPFSFVYRTPNIYSKFALYNEGGWHLAGQIATYYLLDQASRSFLSPMYTSRLDNPDFNIVLIPVSFAATREVSNWLQIHQTLTALTFRSSNNQLQNQTSFGYSAVAELIALTHHSVLLHLEEIGFWNHDLFILGSSYRFHNSWLELRAGYFYRFHPGSLQTAPHIAIGFNL